MNWAAVLNDYRPLEKRKITVAYIPVTCQLTCPVTDYISKYSLSGEDVSAAHVSGLSGDEGSADLEPGAGRLHRCASGDCSRRRREFRSRSSTWGIATAARSWFAKTDPIKTFADMRGRTIAIPSRFSDERLLLFRAMKVWGIKPGEIKMVEMAPPDVSGALAAHAIDAFVMGEPFPSQAEMAALGASSFRPANIGRTTCRAFWSCGRI